MTAIIIKNIYRTNLSQPGGLVRVLEIAPSDYNPDGKACYIEHVEPHSYGYEQGTRGWYEDRDLVTVCQYCGDDLTEGERCKNCGLPRSLIPDDYDLGGEPFDYDGIEDYPPDTPDWLHTPLEEFVLGGRSKTVITCNGQVWDVSMTIYANGHRQVTKTQLEDTCWDGTIPF